MNLRTITLNERSQDCGMAQAVEHLPSQHEAQVQSLELPIPSHKTKQQITSELSSSLL
jgi:hypothetical protein